MRAPILAPRKGLCRAAAIVLAFTLAALSVFAVPPPAQAGAAASASASASVDSIEPTPAIAARGHLALKLVAGADGGAPPAVVPAAFVVVFVALTAAGYVLHARALRARPIPPQATAPPPIPPARGNAAADAPAAATDARGAGGGEEGGAAPTRYLPPHNR